MEHGIFTHGMGKFITLSKFFNIPLEALLYNNIKVASHTFKSSPKVSRKMIARLNAIRERNNDIGCRGEEWVYEKELEKLKGTDFEHAVNPNFADDEEAHFDILSFSEDGVCIIIEVKTTTKNADDVFFFSADELQKAKECLKNGDRYEIHRVYHTDNPNKLGRYIIPAEKLFSDYRFVPETYKVLRKEKV